MTLNVLVVGKFHVEGFGTHIAETLETMGHTVTRYEPGKKHSDARIPLAKRIEQVGRTLFELSDSIPAIAAHRARALYRVVERAKPDLVIVCHDFLWPEQVQELKRLSSARVVLWFPDAISSFGRARFLLAPYDALFFKDPYIVAKLRGVLRPPVYYLPECFNPTRHRLPNSSTIDLAPYRCDVATAGNLYSYRIAFFSRLQQYDLKMWGNPPPLWANSPWLSKVFQRHYVAGEEKALAFRGAKIVINNLFPAEIWGLNARAFEVAGMGGFQLVDWRPGLQELFEDSKEIVSFNGMDDLIEKIDYFLFHEEERNRIRAAAQIRATKDHTYTHRLQLLIDTVAGQRNGFQSALLGEH